MSAKTDLRSWLEKVESMGALKRLDGADWDKEIGTIVELNAKAHGPALLFDRVKGIRRVSACWRPRWRSARPWR